MSKLPDIQDPTLLAIDAAMEAHEARKPPRQYLGASGIGHACERKSWLDFRHASQRKIDAKGLRRIQDGFAGEQIMIDRLRMVEAITLMTHQNINEQIGIEDHGGHFRGHLDGMILGLLQAPVKWHVWECKVCDQKKIDALAKLKHQHGEKGALKAWDEIYYGQAQIYMHYTNTDRHYLTACTPGVRDVVTCRTDYDEADALRIIAKAKRVIESKNPPARISTDPSWFQCRWCDHSDICHGSTIAAQSGCRTCVYSTPAPDGTWHCARFDETLDFDKQRAGCPAHLFIPALIPWEQTDAGDDWIEYTKPDGSTWVDGGAK
jgi:hypothetical protein